jgi:hypothetical protein
MERRPQSPAVVIEPVLLEHRRGEERYEMSINILDECRKLVPLGVWIALCKQANVPYVPAEFSAWIPVDELYNAVDGKPGCFNLARAFGWLDQQKQKYRQAAKQFSCRWECCSAEMTKYAASEGMTWCDHYHELTVDDCRMFDCTVGAETRVCIRPWIDALRWEGYPVEFRVFYGPDGFQGVSNYYPQRALPDNGRFRGYAQTCGEYADMLWQWGRKLNLFPIGFSADFIVKPDERIVFLEGGPPHVVDGYCSAHMCCFPEGKIDGYAFALQGSQETGVRYEDMLQEEASDGT